MFDQEGEASTCQCPWGSLVLSGRHMPTCWPVYWLPYCLTLSTCLTLLHQLLPHIEVSVVPVSVMNRITVISSQTPLTVCLRFYQLICDFSPSGWSSAWHRICLYWKDYLTWTCASRCVINSTACDEPCWPWFCYVIHLPVCFTVAGDHWHSWEHLRVFKSGLQHRSRSGWSSGTQLLLQLSAYTHRCLSCFSSLSLLQCTVQD